MLLLISAFILGYKGGIVLIGRQGEYDAKIIVDISLHAFHEVCHFQGIQLACATGYGFGLSTYGHLFAQKFLAVEIMYVLHTVSGAPIFLSCT